MSDEQADRRDVFYALLLAAGLLHVFGALTLTNAASVQLASILCLILDKHVFPEL